jgi:hypothetical protein
VQAGTLALVAVQATGDVDDGNRNRERYYPDGKPMPKDVAHPPGWRPIWRGALDWAGNHKTIIGTGIVVAVGVGAIIVSGGLAAPAVAAAVVF